MLKGDFTNAGGLGASPQTPRVAMKNCCIRLSSYLFSLSLRCGNNIMYYHRGMKGQLLQCTSFVTVACAVVL